VLVRALNASSCQLVRLSVRGNALSDAALLRVARCLGGNSKTLTSLDVSSNDLTGAGLRKIITPLTACATLIRLNVEGCRALSRGDILVAQEGLEGVGSALQIRWAAFSLVGKSAAGETGPQATAFQVSTSPAIGMPRRAIPRSISGSTTGVSSYTRRGEVDAFRFSWSGETTRDAQLLVTYRVISLTQDLSYASTYISSSTSSSPPPPSSSSSSSSSSSPSSSSSLHTVRAGSGGIQSEQVFFVEITDSAGRTSRVDDPESGGSEDQDNDDAYTSPRAAASAAAAAAAAAVRDAEVGLAEARAALAAFQSERGKEGGGEDADADASILESLSSAVEDAVAAAAAAMASSAAASAALADSSGHPKRMLWLPLVRPNDQVCIFAEAVDPESRRRCQLLDVKIFAPNNPNPEPNASSTSSTGSSSTENANPNGTGGSIGGAREEPFGKDGADDEVAAGSSHLGWTSLVPSFYTHNCSQFSEIF
jgi:hypothetical protein